MTTTARVFKLLNDPMLMQEAEWSTSLYLEKFTCKNSPLPCNICRKNARIIAPFFMLAFEEIALAIENDASEIRNMLESLTNRPQGIMVRAVAKLALQKIHDQKWAVERPWRDGIPRPSDKVCKQLPPFTCEGQPAIKEPDLGMEGSIYLYGNDPYEPKEKSILKLVKRKREEKK